MIKNTLINMTASESFKKNKKSNFNFHLGNIESLVNDTDYLINMPSFPWKDRNQYYTRPDGSSFS